MKQLFLLNIAVQFIQSHCHSVGTTSMQCTIFFILSKNAIKYLYTIYSWHFCK